MTGDVEAHLIALCYSQAPEGYNRWAVRLLADKLVELNYIEYSEPGDQVIPDRGATIPTGRTTVPG